MRNKLFIFLWMFSGISLFLYSFTQVDLSLTLSEASIVQTIERGFQYVGWFNRPLSTFLYIGIYLLMFFLYFWTLHLVKKGKISTTTVWKVIFSVTFILMLSYSAFSRDIFNYIFDARIVTVYNENPYIHKALDYPNDPMLSFMHWTHRTYPYGPLWLVLTVPLTFVSNEFFLLSFYLFKLLMASFFILTLWSIKKIGETLKLSNPMLPVVAFAFNPFVLTESLVSAHNDIVMMGLALLGTYFLLRKEKIKGTFLYIISAGIKFATAILIIGFFVLKGLKKTKYFIGIATMLMILAVIAATYRTNFQPWYLLYVAPFASLMIEKKMVRFPLFIFSIANILYYIPYLHEGTWDPPIPEILNLLMTFALILSVISILIFFPGWKAKK